MIDLRSRPDWPAHLAPLNHDNSTLIEPFDEWWTRVRGYMAGLPSVAAEQWVHRHWSQTSYRLPLDQLTAVVETWAGERILSEVYNDDILTPDCDLVQLANHPTGRTMLERGTWDYPLLVLETPGGFLDRFGEHPEARFRLIEGHKRLRFLCACEGRGLIKDRHQVCVLSLLEGFHQ